MCPNDSYNYTFAYVQNCNSVEGTRQNGVSPAFGDAKLD